jgi:hypothetical protein
MRPSKTRFLSTNPAAAANAWSFGHRKERSRSRYHAIAEQGLQFRSIAAVIGCHLGVPVVSKTPDEVKDHFGRFALLAGSDAPTLSKAPRGLGAETARAHRRHRCCHRTAAWLAPNRRRTPRSLLSRRTRRLRAWQGRKNTGRAAIGTRARRTRRPVEPIDREDCEARYLGRRAGYTALLSRLIALHASRRQFNESGRHR